VTPSTLGVTWLGQSTFIYQFPTGLVVCVDPYLSYATSNGGTRERLTPILMPASTLRADVVVTTHDHTDHFDEHSLRPIAERAETVFVGPSSCCEHWRAMKMPSERFVRIDRGESQELAGARFTALYAEHDSGQKRDAIGVLINAGGFSVYQVGDSEYVPQVADQAKGLKPDLLAVPINGRKGNMNHREAALLTRLIEPRAAVPMHYAMFRNNTADPQDFVDACREVGVGSRVVVMQPGARFELESKN
jgi:L-ascorbate metabolism protein UlaG (beta-lactamase superfamily)